MAIRDWSAGQLAAFWLLAVALELALFANAPVFYRLPRTVGALLALVLTVLVIPGIALTITHAWFRRRNRRRRSSD